jgi:SIR2-like protein
VPELDWDSLLQRIRGGKCTPFLGAGATHGLLPGGDTIAKDWAKAEKYPLRECDLARVSQFIAVDKGGDAGIPKERMCTLIEKALNKIDLKQWLSQPDNPIAVLAELPLPVYLTTNYDSLMFEALRLAGKKPRIELCRWNRAVAKLDSVFDRKAKFVASPETPIVYHLHGHTSVPDSLVLTEDDYFDFLLAVAKDEKLLPPRIGEAISSTSLLFVGYRLADVNFRVLFRGLISSMEGVLRKMSVAVQLPPHDYAPEELKNVQDYLDRYFEQTKVRVYWGDAGEFMREVQRRFRE